MSKSILYLTAIGFENATKSNVIFLGDWCKTNCELNPRTQSYRTIDDPWSDRQQRFLDYLYLERLYSVLIEEVSHRQNFFHQTDHSTDYWQRLCGPWLKMIITRAYHGWQCLHKLKAEGGSLSVINVNYKWTELIPNDTEEFIENIKTDNWNQFLFQRIAMVTSLDFHEIRVPEVKDKISNCSRMTKLSTLLKRIMVTMLNALGKINERYLLVSTYVTWPLLLAVCIRLRAVPSFSRRRVKNFVGPPNMLYRKPAKNEKITAQSEFENFITNFIFEQIPYAYVETFADLGRLARQNNWPTRPTAVVSAVRHYTDDVFKYYLAENAKEGTSIRVICHGGGGKYKYSDWQSMDLRLADDYFTWGWRAYSSKCIRGFFIKKALSPRSATSAPRRVLTCIVLTQDKFQAFIDSTPSFSQYYNDYIPRLVSLINALPDAIQRDATLRIPASPSSWVVNTLKSSCNYSVNISTGQNDYYKLLNESRVVLVTYNGTTMVECLFFNIPTVIYWNESHWELEDSAMPYFDALREAEIFHGSEYSALEKIESVWGCPSLWWNNGEVQKARVGFLEWFGRPSSSATSGLKSFMTGQVGESRLVV